MAFLFILLNLFALDSILSLYMAALPASFPPSLPPFYIPFTYINLLSTYVIWVNN